jgi:hypothetical protein
MSSDDHHHVHESHTDMPFNEKLLKMLEHWIKHNEDHAVNYRNWAEKAKTKGEEDAGRLLEEAAEMSIAVNDRFEKALAALSGHK